MKRTKLDKRAALEAARQAFKLWPTTQNQDAMNRLELEARA